jgi:hypothetical protein
MLLRYCLSDFKIIIIIIIIITTITITTTTTELVPMSELPYICDKSWT